MNVIPFNKPFMTGLELKNIRLAYKNSILSGDGPFTRECEFQLEKIIGAKKALLTHSCTAALEMMALILKISPGDEIIMPSFTFVSSANAFVLRGGIPVFVDIRSDTLNLDENKIEKAITKKTKAILVMHYAGVSCEMNKIQLIARKYNLLIIEDAAHAIGSKYNETPLGSIGEMGALSFHETKNIISGEGGALLINKKSYIDFADVIREKGTNRKSFNLGKVDKYNWREKGSSYLPGEITAAFLNAQLDNINKINNDRIKIWNSYYLLFEKYEEAGLLRRPIIPKECQHNAHLFYILLPKEVDREWVLNYCRKENIHLVFHYVPLHSSPAGKKYSKISGTMNVTNSISKLILRLPLWIGIKFSDQKRIVDTIISAIREKLQ